MLGAAPLLFLVGPRNFPMVIIFMAVKLLLGAAPSIVLAAILALLFRPGADGSVAVCWVVRTYGIRAVRGAGRGGCSELGMTATFLLAAPLLL